MDEIQAAILYMLTICMEYKPSEAGTLFGHAWTLGIEEKFYLLWPLILVATIKRPALAAVGGAVALAILFFLFGVTPLLLRGYIGLGFGAGLAMIAMHSALLVQFLSRRMGAAPFLLLLLLAYAASLVWRDQTIWNIAISFGAALTIGSLWFCRDTYFSKFLSWGPLPWLGQLTYAIYLIQSICIRIAEAALRHVPIPTNAWMIFIAAYALAIMGACLLHVCIEKPFIKLGRQIAARFARS